MEKEKWEGGAWFLKGSNNVGILLKGRDSLSHRVAIIQLITWLNSIGRRFDDVINNAALPNHATTPTLLHPV